MTPFSLGLRAKAGVKQLAMEPKSHKGVISPAILCKPEGGTGNYQFLLAATLDPARFLSPASLPCPYFWLFCLVPDPCSWSLALIPALTLNPTSTLAPSRIPTPALINGSECPNPGHTQTCLGPQYRKARDSNSTSQDNPTFCLKPLLLKGVKMILGSSLLF